MLRPILIFSLTLLAGCVTSSGILKMGPDTYSLSVTDELEGVPGAKKAAFAEASAYCEQLKKEILVINTSSNSSLFDSSGQFEMTFRCLDNDDPDYTRPNYKI